MQKLQNLTARWIQKNKRIKGIKIKHTTICSTVIRNIYILFALDIISNGCLISVLSVTQTIQHIYIDIKHENKFIRRIAKILENNKRLQ